MYREGLMDDDVALLALMGIALLIIGGFGFSYSLFGSVTGNVLIVAGIASDAGAAAVNFLRRGRHAIQFEIMRFLNDRHAWQGGPGEFPTVVQSHVNAPTKRFEKYVKDLVRKGFVQWTPEKRLVLLSRGIDLVGDPKIAAFLQEEGKTE